MAVLQEPKKTYVSKQTYENLIQTFEPVLFVLSNFTTDS